VSATASASTEPPTPVVYTEQVMGTVVSFTVAPGRLDESEVRRLVGAACDDLHFCDHVFSTWDPGSAMSRVRRGEMALDSAPTEIAEVLALCGHAREISRGWFDPWALPGGVDPTGLVKGWAVERAASVLRRGGVASAMVNGGGDIATVGTPVPGKSWRIGVRHPWRPDALACVVEIDEAVATSGAYERGEHLLDPFAGIARDRAASATVTGPGLAIADALATALAVAGPDLLVAVEALEGYEAYVIGHDGREESTSGMRFAAA
jgi:thiamine biosynthesis lipoprotein